MGVSTLFTGVLKPPSVNEGFLSPVVLVVDNDEVKVEVGAVIDERPVDNPKAGFTSEVLVSVESFDSVLFVDDANKLEPLDSPPKLGKAAVVAEVVNDAPKPVVLFSVDVVPKLILLPNPDVVAEAVVVVLDLKPPKLNPPRPVLAVVFVAGVVVDVAGLLLPRLNPPKPDVVVEPNVVDALAVVVEAGVVVVSVFAVVFEPNKEVIFGCVAALEDVPNKEVPVLAVGAAVEALFKVLVDVVFDVVLLPKLKALVPEDNENPDELDGAAVDAAGWVVAGAADCPNKLVPDVELGAVLVEPNENPVEVAGLVAAVAEAPNPDVEPNGLDVGCVDERLNGEDAAGAAAF